jgi:hypothetical protein
MVPACRCGEQALVLPGQVQTEGQQVHVKRLKEPEQGNSNYTNINTPRRLDCRVANIRTKRSRSSATGSLETSVTCRTR